MHDENPRRTASRRRIAPVARRWAAVLFAGASLFAPFAAGSSLRSAEVESSSALDERVRETLIDDGPGRSAELARLGPDAIPSLFRLLLEGRFNGSSSQNLTPDHVEAVFRALGEMPPSSLRSFLTSASVTAGGADERRTALGLYARLGNATDLVRIVDLAVGSKGLDASLSRHMRSAVESVLLRDKSGMDALAKLFVRQSLATKAVLLQAVGSVGNADALEWLADLLELGGPLEIPVLTQMGRTLVANPRLRDDRLMMRVRMFLVSRNTYVQREAVLILGRLKDFDAIPDLMDLLEQPNAGLAQNAHWALREITGLRYGLEPRRWLGWYRSELEWWATRAQTLREKIQSGSEAEVVAAINDLCQRRLDRDVIARALLPALDHPSPRVAQLCARALGGLGSWAVTSDLVEYLDHPDAGVRAAAHAALVRVTGEDLPADGRSWHRAGY